MRVMCLEIEKIKNPTPPHYHDLDEIYDELEDIDGSEGDLEGFLKKNLEHFKEDSTDLSMTFRSDFIETDN